MRNHEAVAVRVYQLAKTAFGVPLKEYHQLFAAFSQASQIKQCSYRQRKDFWYSFNLTTLVKKCG